MSAPPAKEARFFCTPSVRRLLKWCRATMDCAARKAIGIRISHVCTSSVACLMRGKPNDIDALQCVFSKIFCVVGTTQFLVLG